MKQQGISFNVPGQTDPAIFVSKNSYAVGATSQGQFQQWVLGMTLGGICDWHSDEHAYQMRVGALQLARPGTAMRWSVPAQRGMWRIVYAVFHPRPHWNEWLNAHKFHGGSAQILIEDTALRARLRRGMETMHGAYTREVLQRDAWALIELEKVLLLLFAHAARSHAPLDARVILARDFLHSNFARRLVIGDVARAAFLSVSQLSLLFTAQIGVAPMQYLERLRLERAGELLAFTPATIGEVAANCGYADAEYFARRFRRYAGQTPRAFRKSKRAMRADKDY